MCYVVVLATLRCILSLCLTSFNCQPWKRQQYLSIILPPSPTISFHQFTECFSVSPRCVSMQNHFVLGFAAVFPLVKIPKLGVVTLFPSFFAVRPPTSKKGDWESPLREGSWWWSVKNVQYLILTFVICPRPDISQSSIKCPPDIDAAGCPDLLNVGACRSKQGDKNTKMSQSRRNLARSYLLIYGVSGAGISATNQARSTLRHGQKISTTPNAEMSILIFCPRYPEFSFFSVTKMPLLSVEVQVFCDSDTWAHYSTFTDQVTSYFHSLMF